jgi:hypothetical protein
MTDAENKMLIGITGEGLAIAKLLSFEDPITAEAIMKMPNETIRCLVTIVRQACRMWVQGKMQSSNPTRRTRRR